MNIIVFSLIEIGFLLGHAIIISHIKIWVLATPLLKTSFYCVTKSKNVLQYCTNIFVGSYVLSYCTGYNLMRIDL